MEHLFVYGTLRPGSRHPMAKFLAEHARHIGPAEMPGRLYDLGRYPGMTDAQDADDQVKGDVFQIEDAIQVLGRLDEYEGVTGDAPRLFERKSGIAKLEDGSKLTAWFYEYQGATRSEGRIWSGDYSDEQRL